MATATFRCAALACLLPLASAGQDVASEISEARRYESAREYRKAAEHFETAAKLGSGEAAYSLAIEYSLNRLPPTRGLLKVPHPDPEYNWNMTRVWMLDAATKNYPLACAWMGWFYEDGYRNGRSDVEQSTRTTVQAPPPDVPAGGGFAGGLAAGLANGLSKRRAGQTTIDTKSKTDVLNGPQYTEAMNWYRRAADQNEPKSMYAIGRFYERGFGVPVNIDLAMKWYAKAVALGQSDARVRLEILSEQQHP